MTKIAKPGDARPQLSTHLINTNKVEETGIASFSEALLRLTAERQKQKVREAVDRIRSARRKNGCATAEEILLWRDEGRL